MSQNLGQEPAFPIIEEQYDGVSQVFKQECTSIGMSKRFYAACALMQGMLANIKFLEANSIAANQQSKKYDEFLVYTAYSLADELLKQENQ